MTLKTIKELEAEAQYWLLDNHYSNLEMTDNKNHKKWRYISDLMARFTEKELKARINGDTHNQSAKEEGKC